jgi:hypothetical protein
VNHPGPAGSFYLRTSFAVRILVTRFRWPTDKSIASTTALSSWLDVVALNRTASRISTAATSKSCWWAPNPRAPGLAKRAYLAFLRTQQG